MAELYMLIFMSYGKTTPLGIQISAPLLPMPTLYPTSIILHMSSLRLQSTSSPAASAIDAVTNTYDIRLVIDGNWHIRANLYLF